jgi:hypothetical protein
VRLSFQRPGGKPDLLFVFGLTGVREGRPAHEVATNLTLIVQGTDRIYGTLGDSRCTVDSLSQRRLGPGKSYRLEARGFCTQPAHAVRGEGVVLVSTFEFAGVVNYEGSPRAPARTHESAEPHRPGDRPAPHPAILMVCYALCGASYGQAAVPIYDYEIVHVYPHDPEAFTEGLFYLNGYLYESTGLEHHSSIRKVRLQTGEVLERYDIPGQYFGEGIVNWDGRLIELTWQSHVGFVYDLKTFKRQGDFHYEGEGWALTQDGSQIYMSDGTSTLRILNPKTLLPAGMIPVTLEGKPVER